MRSMIYTMLAFCLCLTIVDVSAGNEGASQISGFIENKGQWPSNVLFLARQAGADVWITKTDVVLDQYTLNSTKDVVTGTVTKLPLFENGTYKTSIVRGEPTRVNFVIGNDPSKWVSANAYESLVVENAIGSSIVTFSRHPDGRIISLAAKRSRSAKSEDVLEVDPATSTVYGTYLGASALDVATGVHYTTSGNVLVVGYTASMQFPGVTGGYSISRKGATDGFIAKLNGKLQRVIAYTFIGGGADDKIKASAVDGSSAICITGETTSTDFPITAGVSGQLYKSMIDGFVSRLDSNLAILQMSTYLGGNKDDLPVGIATGTGGMIYVCGTTTSTTNFPVTFPVSTTIRDFRGRETTVPGGGANGGQSDGFVTCFSNSGNIVQSRYFGVEGIEKFTSMALDPSNAVFITGSTTSANFETAPTPGMFASSRVPYDRTFNGGTTDGFVVKFNNELALAKGDDGTYSTYFGGAGEDETRGVFVDALGRAYVVGVTTSTNLPTVGTLYTTALGKQDVFLAVFSDDGRELASATYFGGAENDDVLGVKPHTSLTTAMLYGSTTSNDFPVFGEGAINERSGLSDGYITLMNTSNNLYTTLVHGTNVESVKTASVDAKGDVFYIVNTTSENLPTHDSAFQPSGMNSAMYVAKHAFGTVELTVPRGGESWCLANNQTISWQVTGMQASEKYAIEYSADGGATWKLLVKDVTGTNYQWKPTSATTPAGEQYQIRVSTARGHITSCSNFAFVMPPSIVNQPKSASSCDGGSVSLTVDATGEALRYQWRRNGANVPSNGTEKTYVIAAVNAGNAGSYDCIISGSCSPSVTTTAAAVVVGTATGITTQPASKTIYEAEPLTLTIAATGSLLAYQWQLDGYNVTGATTATYTVASASAADAGTYRCVVTGGCGTVTSTDAVVVVKKPDGVEEDVLPNGMALKIVGPNPSTDEVTVSVTMAQTTQTFFRIVDQHGNVMWTSGTSYINEGVTSVAIPVGQLASGVYGLEAHAGTSVLRTTVRVAR